MVYLVGIFSSWVLLCSMLGIELRKILSLKSLNPLHKARALQGYLMQSPQTILASELPSYKFFSDLVVVLLKNRVQSGAKIEQSLMEIKKALVVDIKESKKLFEIIQTSILQQIFLSLYVVCFTIVSRRLLEINESKTFGILLFMSTGLVLFIFLLLKLQKMKFKTYDSYFISIYNFKTLLSVSLPLNQVIEESQLLTLPPLGRNQYIKMTLIKIVEGIKKSGRLNQLDIELVLEELWNEFSLDLEKFKKSAMVLKLMCLMLFAVPAFLYSVLDLIEQIKI